MFNKAFWRAAFERAIKAGANVVVTTMVVGDVVLNAFDTDWGNAAGVFGGGFILSILMSLASSGITGGGPSLSNAEVLGPPK